MADDLKCKLKILGADPNNPKKPARFSGDPAKKKAQKRKRRGIYCRRGIQRDIVRQSHEAVFLSSYGNDVVLF